MPAKGRLVRRRTRMVIINFVPVLQRGLGVARVAGFHLLSLHSPVGLQGRRQPIPRIVGQTKRRRGFDSRLIPASGTERPVLRSSRTPGTPATATDPTTQRKSGVWGTSKILQPVLVGVQLVWPGSARGGEDREDLCVFSHCLPPCK